MTDSNSQTLLIIFVGLTGLAVLLQAGVLLGIFLTVRKAVNLAKEQADAYRPKLIPVIESGHKLVDSGRELVNVGTGLVNSLTPEIKGMVAEVSEITRSLHAQTERLQAQADEMAERLRQQTERVDGMTTTLLNRVDRAGRFLNDAVNAPIRQVNGVVAAARAVVDTLRTPTSPRTTTRTARTGVEVPIEEKDLFV